MCGIIGEFSNGSPLDTLTFSKDDLELIKHRGPDSEGWYVDKHCMMGFRRLAIIDRSGGQQPLYNENKSIVLTVNGEIYNHHNIRKSLIAHHDFMTKSDGEVLLHLYEDKGLGFLADVNGMFAFALHDRRMNRLVLCRDRAGKKPLYYRLWKGNYVWSSEIKVLTRFDLPRINKTALADYLRFGYVPAPLTMFEGIFKISAAHMAIIENDQPLKMEQYWSLHFNRDDWDDPGVTKCEDIKQELVEQFDKSVGMRLESEVPIGFLLSGGVDSASVYASGARQLGKDRAFAFTIGFADQGVDESHRASEVAAKCGGQHSILRLQQSRAEALIEIVSAVEEPVSTDALLPTNEVFNGIAQTNVVTVFAGEGSDEIFAGYNKFRFATPWGEDYSASFPSPLERYLANEEFVFSNESDRILLLDGDYDSRRFEKIEKEAMELDPLSQMLLFETRLRLPDRINLRLDRLSMAYSIEARAPFMDYKFMEFCANIPHSLRITKDVDKYILREAMRERLPESVIQSKKTPFHAPKKWFTSSSAMMDTFLSSEAVLAAGMVNPRAVEMFRELATDPNNHAAAEKVYSLFVLHLWHSCFYGHYQQLMKGTIYERCAIEH
jgi:asparagine synthase (glutamine-hydrolysing)